MAARWSLQRRCCHALAMALLDNVLAAPTCSQAHTNALVLLDFLSTLPELLIQWTFASIASAWEQFHDDCPDHVLGAAVFVELEFALWSLGQSDANGVLDLTSPQLPLRVAQRWFSHHARMSACSELRVGFSETLRAPAALSALLESAVQLSHIQTLNLDGLEGLTDEHLMQLSACISALRHLNVSCCSGVSETGVLAMLEAHSATLLSLRCNELSYQLSDAVLPAIARCSHLQVLELQECASLDHLPDLGSLRALTVLNVQGLGHVRAEDFCTQLAPVLTRLESLRLAETHVQRLTLASQPQKPLRLRQLDLSWCFELEHSAVQFLLAHSPLLSVLQLRNLSIDDSVFAALCTSELSALDLERCDALTSTAFASLVTTTRLERVNVSWTTIDSNTLGALMRNNSTTLRTVRAQGCKHVDSAVATHLIDTAVDDWPLLECVDLQWTEDVADGTIAMLRAALPYTEWIGYYGGEDVDDSVAR